MKNYILPLKNQKSFNFVSSRSYKFSCEFFTIIYASFNDINLDVNLMKMLSKKTYNEKFNNIYLGFKVSRKYGKSVERNLLKRRIRHIIRSFNATENCGIIFIPRKSFQMLNFTDIINNINKALKYFYKKNENKKS